MLTRSTSLAVCNRVSLGGVSLLLVVAFALQASSGMIEHRHLSQQGRECSSVRQIAETQARPQLRLSRRQDHRPAIRTGGLALRIAREGVEPVRPSNRDMPVARRPMARETDLPPPAMA